MGRPFPKTIKIIPPPPPPSLATRYDDEDNEERRMAFQGLELTLTLSLLRSVFRRQIRNPSPTQHSGIQPMMTRCLFRMLTMFPPNLVGKQQNIIRESDFDQKSTRAIFTKLWTFNTVGNIKTNGNLEVSVNFYSILLQQFLNAFL